MNQRDAQVPRGAAGAGGAGGDPAGVDAGGVGPCGSDCGDAAGVDRPLIVAAVDDHPFVLAGVEAVLAVQAPWIRFLAKASSVAELLRGPGRRAQLVLLDLRLSAIGEDDVAGNVRQVRSAGPQVVVLTSELRPVPLRAAVSAGAVGVVLKADPPEKLVATLRTARTGELAVSSALAHALVTDEALIGRLSPREQKVFALLAQGLGRTEIGRLLTPPVSTHAVDACVKKVAERYRELGRNTFNSYETLAHVIRDGYVDYRP